MRTGAPEVAVLPVRQAAGSIEGRRTADTTAAGITLAEVHARQVPVLWSEAVATIEGLCAVLLEQGAASTRIPDPKRVMVTSDGTVVVPRIGGIAGIFSGLPFTWTCSNMPRALKCGSAIMSATL
jgi:hypothetical protein